jgi:SulP family sulfate permease
VALVLAGLVALFWLLAAATGATQAELAAQGLLLPATGDQGPLWPPALPPGAFGDVAWSLLPAQLPALATAAVLSAVVLLLNASGIEIATRRDMDLSHELRWIGAANVAAGLGGGWPGYFALGGSVLTFRLQAPIRFVGVVTALACLGAMLAGAPLLAYVPKMAGAALIAFIGIGFLADWLYGSWRRMERPDLAVLLLVFGTIILFGLVEGIVIGTAAGVALFVVRYSQIGVLRHVMSGANYHSRVDRAPGVPAVLAELGDQIVILRLQGYVFFGTGNALVSFVRRRIDRTDIAPLRCLVFDFRLVTGMDASAAASFTKLAQYAEDYGFTILVCRPSEVIGTLLLRGDDAGRANANPVIRVFDELDTGLEWAEDALLAAHVVTAADEPAWSSHVLAMASSPADAERLQGYLETYTFSAGESLVHQGDASDDIFFIESGRVNVLLGLDGGNPVRLRSMGAGTVVGEVAYYLGVSRSASVVAAEPTVAERLTGERLAAMQRDDPDLASALHRYLARMLATRLTENNRLLVALNE